MEGLGLDMKLMIAQIVNFVLFFILFAKFIAPPFREFLHKSKQAQEDKNRALLDIKAREEQIIKEQTESIEQAQLKSTAILKQAEEHAMKKRQEILKKAKKEAEDIKQKAHESLEDEKKQLYIQAKKYIITTSSNLVKAALSDVIDSKIQREILKRVTKGVKAKDIYEN